MPQVGELRMREGGIGGARDTPRAAAPAVPTPRRLAHPPTRAPRAAASQVDGGPDTPSVENLMAHAGRRRSIVANVEVFELGVPRRRRGRRRRRRRPAGRRAAEPLRALPRPHPPRRLCRAARTRRAAARARTPAAQQPSCVCNLPRACTHATRDLTRNSSAGIFSRAAAADFFARIRIYPMDRIISNEYSKA